MNIFLRSIIVAVVVLLSGCYVRPGFVRHDVVRIPANSYSTGYYPNSYYNSNNYYNKGSWQGYQKGYYDRNRESGKHHHHHNDGHHNNGWGYQNNNPNHNHRWGNHQNNNGYNNRSGQQWQGGWNSGHQKRH